MPAYFLSPMVLSGFIGRSGWHENDLAGGVRGHRVRARLRYRGVLFHLRRQQRALVTHCQQITALNHNLHLSDKSLSTAAHTSTAPTPSSRKHERGSILSYGPRV